VFNIFTSETEPGNATVKGKIFWSPSKI